MVAQIRNPAVILVLNSLLGFGSSIDLPNTFDQASCPLEFRDNPPLIVLSMDGFRADYIKKGYTPTIEALSKRGVMTPFMKPSYPSITFPNHYTLVTGLLPPYHGIVANSFFAPNLKANFTKRSKALYQKRFWGGEPIWVTAEKQGKIAASYFWPGSETESQQPTYWKKFNSSIPFKARVQGVLSWLDLPRNKRPDLINFYLNEPDRQGHEHGPNSPQLDKALREVDDTVLLLLEGLQDRNLLSCVNLIILADHGMAAAGEDRVLHLQEFLPNINRESRYFNGVFPRFQPLDKTLEKAVDMMKEIACKYSEMRVYHKHHLPTRWHFGGQNRIEEVVLDLDPGYQVDFDGTYSADEGDHGYDNIFFVMNALFLAYGPSFKRNVEVESFQNIELYNLMCTLLGVNPAPNNGTWGSLHHLLVSPPPVERLYHIKIPPIAKVPKSSLDIQRRLQNEEEGESLEDISNVSKEWISSIQKSELKYIALLKKHLPWGVPQGIHKLGTKLLLHQDHITGYSETLKLPLWVAYHLSENEGSHPTNWADDVRIPAERLNTPWNDDQLQSGFEWDPLFHSDFSQTKKTSQIPYLNSNAVPVTSQLKKNWKQLRELLRRWGKTYRGGVNVVMGTIFDYDFDTLYDDLSKKRFGKNKIVIPTHLFAIVTRCLGNAHTACPPDSLDVNAFIFPQYLPTSNCMSFENFAREFSAKVDDVEKISGLEFNSLLSYTDRVRLKVRFHSNIWGLEKWENRIRSDMFGLKKR